VDNKCVSKCNWHFCIIYYTLGFLVLLFVSFFIPFSFKRSLKQFFLYKGASHQVLDITIHSSSSWCVWSSQSRGGALPLAIEINSKPALTFFFVHSLMIIKKNTKLKERLYANHRFPIIDKQKILRKTMKKKVSLYFFFIKVKANAKDFFRCSLRTRFFI